MLASLLPERLEAVLVQQEGYHQIGPPELCCDMFLLSVTVAFATKLEQVGGGGGAYPWQPGALWAALGADGSGGLLAVEQLCQWCVMSQILKPPLSACINKLWLISIIVSSNDLK